jgi:predicted DNA-binding protein YlxM (UPF0122 family)
MAQIGYQSDPLKNRLSKERFIELHHNQGVPQAEIARRFNVSVSSLIRLKKQYDIPTNKNIKKLQTGQQRKKVSLENQTLPEEIKRLYWEDKLSLAEIGKRFCVDRAVVFGYMKRHKISTRNKSRARKLAADEGRLSIALYEVNEKFFSKWSAKMAWVLGCIFADGNIHPQAQGTYCLSISSKDTSLLQNIKNAMNSTHPIKKVVHKQWFIYRLFITRPQINNDLSQLGITPRKSLTISFPKIPYSFLPHFIRGVFDGDGSVFFEPRSKKSPLRVSFVSGSKAFMSTLETKLCMHAGLSKRIIYETHLENTSYYIRYSHQDSLKFFNYIYEDADETIRLERKYKKFIEGGVLSNGI